MMYCAFCGLPANDHSVLVMIAGQSGSNICDQCVLHASKAIREHCNARTDGLLTEGDVKPAAGGLTLPVGVRPQSPDPLY